MRKRAGLVYQLHSGRWAVRLECPDGIVRRFLSSSAQGFTPEEDAIQRTPRVRRLRRPVAVRFDVFARDNYTCQYCGRKAPDVVLHVDHRVPVSKGGTDEPANLLTACADCNQGKADRHSGGVVDPRPDLYETQFERMRSGLNALWEHVNQAAKEADG